jgi:S1-C subfamily serine protease
MVAAVGVLLAVIAGLVACGGSHQSAATTTTTTSSSATGVEQQFIEVVKTVSPEVVQIQTPSGLGSGVVFDANGNIITNAHVVGSYQQFMVTLSGGANHKATLVGSYPQGDVAVVHLTDANPHPAVFADSSKIKVGEFALAIGNPLGLRSSVTEGIVSSVGRTVSEGNGATIPSAIQTSAPINPGNSGGALVDINGHVIGIPTLAALNPELGGAPAPGIGFAIPSNTAQDIARKLISSGHISPAQRGYLGVEVATIVGGGVLVQRVVPGGPAAKAGIQPGEVIVAVAGQPTPTAEDLTTLVASLTPGQQVDVTVVKPTGQQANVRVTVGKPPGG